MSRVIAVVLCVAVAGCATVEPVAEGSKGALALLQQPGIRDDSRLRELFELESNDDARDLAAAAARYATFEDKAHGELRDALTRAGFLVVDAPLVTDPGAPLESEPFFRYNARSAPGEGRVLRFRITDLGYSPRAWKGWYAAWEITSTIAIAAAAYAVPKTRPIAGAYFLEESFEELTEGYAGFWLLDRVWSPVRLEAALVDLRTGEVAWAGAATGFADFKLGRILKRPRGARQDAQIDRALRDAAEGLAGGLQRALK